MVLKFQFNYPYFFTDYEYNLITPPTRAKKIIFSNAIQGSNFSVIKCLIT